MKFFKKGDKIKNVKRKFFNIYTSFLFFPGFETFLYILIESLILSYNDQTSE